MAVTNTGIVLRTITGVNESDLFLDSEATSVTTNTGIVERAITGLNESVAFRQDTRTNLVTYSEDFSNAYWSKFRLSVLSNSILSPKSDLTASSLIEDSTLNTHVLRFTYTPNVNSYTFSVFVKSLSGNRRIVLNSGFATDFALFDLSSGTIISEANIDDASIKSYNNGWCKISVTKANISGSSFDLRLDNGTSVTYQGDGTSGVYIWGAQLEEASQATSYIYTNGAAVTVDSNSTSVVNNTGIVERPITGVNESDPMFPDNTTSTVVNISDTIIPLLTALEARATTFENRECTQNILINLEKC